MVIKTDRTVIARQLCILFATVVPAFLVFYFKYPQYSKYYLVPLAALLLYSVFPLFRGFATGIAFTITNRGLSDGIGPVDWVAWDEITRADMRSTYTGLHVITLWLHNTNAVIGRLPLGRRFRVSFGGSYSGAPELYGDYAEGGAERLLTLIRQRLNPRPAGSSATDHAPLHSTPAVVNPACPSPHAVGPGYSHTPASSGHAWICYRCGASNEPNTLQCKSCGFGAPHPNLASPQIAPKYPWACPKCGLNNDGFVSAVCVACGCPAYSPQTGPPDPASYDLQDDRLFAYIASAIAVLCGIWFAVVLIGRGYILLAIVILLGGCVVVPWLEYRFVRGDHAPFARLILYGFFALVVIAAAWVTR